MSEELTTYQQLAAPFAVSEHATVNKGGGDQTYAPWTEYVERLNTVLQPEHWSFRVIREGFTETECWVLGEITALIDGVETVRQQYGCEPIVKGREAKPTTDLLKIAASDALKKAASLIGPGLYLSIKEERIAIQAAMREASKPAPRTNQGQGSPADSDRVRKAATVGGANPPSGPTAVGRRCREEGCDITLADEATVSILKKKDGPRVDVKVAEFAPVCIERLKGFYCAEHYDQRYWGAA